MDGTDGTLGFEEEAVVEEPEPAPKPSRPREPAAEPVVVHLWRDAAGYHFVALDAGGQIVRGSRSKIVYATAHTAKREAHAAYPTLPIR